MRNYTYLSAQLAVDSAPNELAQSFYQQLRNPGPIYEFLTADCRKRRTPSAKDTYNGGVAESVVTNGMRAVYVSIDRVSEDQAKRIAASLATRPIELLDEGSIRQVLVDILGSDFNTVDVGLD